MNQFLFFLFIISLTNFTLASTVILNADPSFKGNYINFFAFNQSNTYPSQNDLIPLGQIGPRNLNSAGHDPISAMQSTGVQVSTAKVQVAMVLANSTKQVQTFCSTKYYDFSMPTTVNFDATHSAFIPGPCAPEITHVSLASIY